MHIASAVGTPVVLLLDKRAPESYLPQGDRHRVIYNSVIGDITVDEVYEATRSILAPDGRRRSSPVEQLTVLLELQVCSALSPSTSVHGNLNDNFTAQQIAVDCCVNRSC